MKKKALIVSFAVVAIASVAMLASCAKYDPNLKSYDMNIYDISAGVDNMPPAGVPEEYQYMYTNYVTATPTELAHSSSGKKEMYLGHPDNVLLDDGTILTAYPKGHGRGETMFKASRDGGVTWLDFGEYGGKPLPDTFLDTQETPTLYKLDFVDENGNVTADTDQKLILISGRPGWGKPGAGQGFDVSISTSKGANGKCDGKEWSAQKNYFSKHAEAGYEAKNDEYKAIVAMSSLTQVKENGKFINKWMSIFHDYNFHVYKTFLTFDEKGNMDWTKPEYVITNKEDRKLEKKYQFCECEVIRSPEGNELAMLCRVNAKKSYSYVLFSTDEGKTWGHPEELSMELTGERHKAEYTPDGKLVITFRSIDWKQGQEKESSAWYSRGWVAWVGNYSDLHKGHDAKGDFVLKLAHTYLNGQTEPQESANADTGYAGLTIDKDGNIVTTSYGRFSPDSDPKLGENTYIVTKKFRLDDICGNFNITMREGEKPSWARWY